MEAEAIYEELKKLAPKVAFSDHRELDPHDVWDGDAPDPREDGFDAYDVIVSARAIIDGEVITGEETLGSSYYKPDEPTGDAHGYLPQMLERAADELLEQIEDETIKSQLEAVKAFLTKEMKDRYDAQRAEIEAAKAAQA